MAKPFVPFGATGQFPRGKLHKADEGELRYGVTVERGTVIVMFGAPVVWVGLSPQKARDFAARLLHWAGEAAKAQ